MRWKERCKTVTQCKPPHPFLRANDDGEEEELCVPLFLNAALEDGFLLCYKTSHIKVSLESSFLYCKVCYNQFFAILQGTKNKRTPLTWQSSSCPVPKCWFLLSPSFAFWPWPLWARGHFLHPLFFWQWRPEEVFSTCCLRVHDQFASLLFHWRGEGRGSGGHLHVILWICLSWKIVPFMAYFFFSSSFEFIFFPADSPNPHTPFVSVYFHNAANLWTEIA